MQHHAIEAPEALRATIKGFWYTTIAADELAAGFEIIPDGYAEIIFYFGSACSVATQEGWLPLPSPFLVGLLNRPITLTAASRLQVIGIKCFPWTVFDLLGLPAGNDGVRIMEHPIAQLQGALAACLRADKVAEALTQVQAYFLATQVRIAAGSLLGKAGAAMRAGKGTLPVSQVAAAAHATVRTLERNFKQAAGHTVKDVSGLMRFEQVRNHLWRQPAASLAGLAQELGYADQAHLSREFKRYSGTTPAAFARKARSGQQALPTLGFVAFVQA
jgi:AraC-like DNA-binding protein